MSNAELLSRAGLPSMYALLRQRRLRWPGHVHCMNDGRIPKDILYGELATPRLRYKDICLSDMKALDIDAESWRTLQLTARGGEVL